MESYRLLGFVALLLLSGVTLLAPDIQAQDACEPAICKITSIQGSVTVKRKGSAQWTQIRLNDTFCPGDRISTGANSRAVVVLNIGTVLRMDQETSIAFLDVEEEKSFLLSIFKGAAHFFSRKYRSLKITTPLVNGGVEGTEFLVKVDPDETLFSLFEGRLLAENAYGELLLAKGQSAITRSDQPPQLKLVARPRDAVHWALYYPPIIFFNPEDTTTSLPDDAQSKIRRSIEAYRQGDLVQAFAMLEGLGDNINDAPFFIYRASLYLTVGRFAKAEADTERALALDAGNSEALALRSISAVVQNQKEAALETAHQAVALNANSSAALIALSYAHQARFDLSAAIAQAQLAVDNAPDNAIARARLAELRLSIGDLDGALRAARRATELDTNSTHAQTVMGYAHLTQMEIKAAETAFVKAIHLDSAAPLPRLGLGLAKIRQGHLKIGRAEIEIAAGLDPANALIRSYLGKAYFDEKRSPLEERQFEIAKELDPQDPTPWFYDAIRKQTQNRPVAALLDLQKSIELNDNRAVYRSRLLMDEDLAARSASLGRVYNDLNFQELALRQGWRSLQTDPANYSAHRLLADAYRSRPRHEVARVSELLQAQLLQPLSLTPVQSQLAESNLLILESGPADSQYVRRRPGWSIEGYLDHW